MGILERKFIWIEPFSVYMIIRADGDTFKKHKTELMDIYIEACGSEYMAQYVESGEEELRIAQIFEKGGYGFFGFHENKLTGFLLVTPLSHDALLPETMKEKYPIERCLYVAEIHIHEDYRRKGIGTNLMNAFMKDADRKKYDYVVIRTWIRNIPAMNLYRKLGFVPGVTVEEEKIKPDRSETFIMLKQYLVRKLSE